MTRNLKNFAAGFFRDESGQTMVIATVSLVVLLAMCGFVVDLGHAIVVNRQLQAGTNAAALAGGQALPATSYSTAGYAYSTSSSDANKYSTLPGVSTNVQGYCSAYVSNTLGIGCSGASGYNAVVVTQKVTIPTYFISVLGINNITLTSTAIAAERGATPIPYNVAFVLDQTASMQDTDSDSQCSTSREACAQSGFVTLLQNLAPCPITQTSCGTATANSSGDGGAEVSPAEDHVALFQFPNATFVSTPNAYNCNGGSTNNGSYNLTPTSGMTSYDPTTGSTYLIVGYSSDFKTNPQKSTLNKSSNIVRALGGAGCKAETAVGGAGTYYASVLYAAQGSLMAEQKAFPNTSNVIVMISDGEASSTQSQLGPTATAKGSYPSYRDECNQAVIAGQAAATAGTKVYAVSYGSEASACSDGSAKNSSGNEAADFAGYTAAITPCQTMQAIASSTANFYSDYTSNSGSGNDTSCIGTATSTNNLQNIFTDIAYTLTSSRLLNAGLNSGCSASNTSKCQ